MIIDTNDSMIIVTSDSMVIDTSDRDNKDERLYDCLTV